MGLMASDPDLAKLIMENRDAFRDMLLEEAAGAPASGVDAIRAHPKFEELKAKLAADPSQVQTVVMGLMASDPDLAKLIMENRDAFRDMLLAEAAGAPAAAAAAPEQAEDLMAKFDTLVKKLGYELTVEQAEAVFKAVVEAKPEDQMMNVLAMVTGFDAKSSLDEAITRANTGPFSSFPPLGDQSHRADFTIGGTVAPGYEPVKAAFAGNFELGLERDSQLCIYHKGERVVDLWGSCNEPGVSTAPAEGYDADTLQIVFSSTKACSSVVMAVAADRGLFKYADKVSQHWPEFAQAGKADMTVADVLRHDGKFTLNLPLLAIPRRVLTDCL